MSDRVPCVPEIGFRCREFISRGKVSSACRIPGTLNPVDTMTKANPNSAIQTAIETNICSNPSKHVFMLQKSPYRHLNWIPTTKVPMRNDARLKVQAAEDAANKLEVSIHINSSGNTATHLPGSQATLPSPSQGRDPLVENTPHRGSEAQSLCSNRYSSRRVRDGSAHLISYICLPAPLK